MQHRSKMVDFKICGLGYIFDSYFLMFEFIVSSFSFSDLRGFREK